jgi:3-dehydroquinate synthase
MRRMTLQGRTGTCEIAVGGSLGELLRPKAGARVVAITDPNVRSLHGARFPEVCGVIEIGQGESTKTLSTVASIYERFLELELDRSSFVVAIGGGIVCDVAAFAAATWMRGIPFGLVPTTLIAQADAGVGGKNGVNLHEYKNLVGTFCQPRFCYCDPSFLATLPERELRFGLAEVIKHGAIGDPDLFSFVEQELGALLGRAPAALERVVDASLRLKAAIVARDETERGERRLLNFGHTVGHAIERVAGMAHGEAVSIGMAAAARLSVRRGLLGADEAGRLQALLTRAGLPTRLPVAPAELMDAIRRDKKREGAAVRMALLSRIGRADLAEVGFQEIEEGIA